MILNIIVSDNYNNNKLNELLSLNDFNINENILNFGTSTYLNQEYIIKNDNTFLQQIKHKDTIIKDIYYKHSIEIKDKDNIILNLNNKYSSQYNDQINNFHDQINQLNQIIINLKNQHIHDTQKYIQKGKELSD
jgi:hypothetical protein